MILLNILRSGRSSIIVDIVIPLISHTWLMKTSNFLGSAAANPHLNVGTGFEQMLPHVVHEVVQQLDLLLKRRRVLSGRVVVLATFVVDVVNVPEIRRQVVMIRH